MKMPRIAILLSICFTLTLSSRLSAQSAGTCLSPTVGLYDCNYLPAVTDSVSAVELSSSSYFIYEKLISDSETSAIVLFTFGHGDSLVGDTLYRFQPVTSPDSVGATGVDYSITSSITGGTGSYVVSVFLKNLYNGDVVAHGTADFSSLSGSDFQAACDSAVSAILPIEVKIHSYEDDIRTSNPAACINPQIQMTPLSSYIGLRDSTRIALSVTDCDGFPLGQRTLTLSTNAGSVSPQTVQTDADGNAVATFSGGSKSVVATLTADMGTTVSITGDSSSPESQVFVFVGEPDTANLGKLDFTMSVQYYDFSDTNYDDGVTTYWNQGHATQVWSASGSWLGYYTHDDSSFNFSADTIFALQGGMFEDGLIKYEQFSFNDESNLYTGYNYFGTINMKSPGNISGYYTPSDYIFAAQVNYLYNGNDYSREYLNDDLILESNKYNINRNSQASISFFNGDPRGGIVYLGGIATIYFHSTSLGIGTTFSGTIKPLSTTLGVKGISHSLPANFKLDQNYPDPFNPVTVIRYDLPKLSQVSIVVYDILGRKVETLVNEEKSPGHYQVSLDASRLPSGVYFYRLQAGAFTQTKKMLLLK